MSTKDADDSVTFLSYFHVVICLLCILRDMMGVSAFCIIFWSINDYLRSSNLLDSSVK